MNLVELGPSSLLLGQHRPKTKVAGQFKLLKPPKEILITRAKATFIEVVYLRTLNQKLRDLIFSLLCSNVISSMSALLRLMEIHTIFRSNIYNIIFNMTF